MKVKYKISNILILFVSLLLGGLILFGVHELYLVPLKADRQLLRTQLQELDARQQDLIKKSAQINELGEDSYLSDDLSTVIPIGDIQPERLLATLADAAQQVNITLIDQHFGENIFVSAPIEIKSMENKQTLSLIKVNLVLNLEGDNEEQFQDFIRLIEGDSRLIQVKAFTLDQGIEEFPSDQERDEMDPEDEDMDLEADAQTDADLDEYLEDGQDHDKEAEIEETASDLINVDDQQKAMKASIRLAVYFFE